MVTGSNFKPIPDVECLKYHGTPDKPDIKIFVSHRIDLDSETIDNPLYIPVRCGAVYDEREDVTMLGDDTGDNISELRDSFCELTVLYWAWKNVKADYYGLCHYRRYISFAEERYPVKRNEYPWGCVSAPAINKNFATKFNLNEEAMSKEIASCDIIASDPVKMSWSDGDWKSNEDYIKGHKNDFSLKDYQMLKDVVHELTPEMDSFVNEYFEQAYSNWYNCYILKRDIFFEFCEWLFSILFEFTKRLDTSLSSSQRLREPGFFGEHLWGIFLLYLQDKDEKEIKYKQLCCIEKTTRQDKLLPAFRDNNVPIVMMSSDYYVPYFGVLLTSIINNATDEHNYDIIVLQKDITTYHKKQLLKIVEKHTNFSLRFFDPYEMIGDVSFYVASPVYSEIAYYRLLSPWILNSYDKAIIMDCDIVAKTDIAKLYDYSVEGYLLAGVKDVVFQGMLNYVDTSYLPYCKTELKMKDPYTYINTGVLVMNLAEIRNAFSLEEIVQFSAEHEFRIQEQDIINSLMQGRINFIDVRWNLYVETSAWISACIDCAPIDSSKYYKEAVKAPYLIHYANNPKPWDAPYMQMSDEFWSVARETLFYEELLERLMNGKQRAVEGAIFDLQNRLGYFDMRTNARKLADKVLPKGTKRRDVAKTIMPKGSPLWRFCKQIYYIFRPEYRPVKIQNDTEEDSE